MGDFSKDLLAELKSRLSRRDYIALLLIVLMEFGAFWFSSHDVTLIIALSLTLPLTLGLWYAWISYRKHFAETLRRIALAGLILASLVWTYGVWSFRTSDHRKIAQQMKRGQELAIQLNYGAAMNAFDEARKLANRIDDKSAEASALCDLGEAQAKIGQVKEAELSLLTCIALADEVQFYPLEASGYAVLGRLEAFHDPFSARQHFKNALTAAAKKPESKYVQAEANLSLGDLAKNLGQIDEANVFYQTAGAMFREQNDLQDSMATLVGTGELKVMQGHFAAARNDYSDALKYYQSTGNDLDSQSHALVLLGDLEREAGDNRKAREDYQAALGLLTQDPDGRAYAVAGLAELERKLGDTKDSRKDYGDALALFQKMNDEVGMKNVLVGLGQLETMVGQYAQAHHALDQAEDTSGKDDYPLGYANALVAAGDLSREEGNYDLARQCYVDAEKAYTDFGTRTGEADAWLGFGRLEEVLGNSGPAAQDFTRAWDLYEQQHIFIGEAEVQLARGDLQRKLKHYAEARTFYKDSLAKYEEQDGRAGQARVLLARGDLELESGGAESAALQYYGEALGLCQQQENLIGQANVNFSEGLLLQKHGKAADSYFDKALDLYHQIGMQKKVEEIQKLESQTKPANK